MTLGSFHSSASTKFLSTPELWVNCLFNHLPISSIETLLSVNKHLRSLSRKITHPTHLGGFPIEIWSNHILPLLDYKNLKKFQNVSQVARRLTLSKKMSKHLFRSDVDLEALKENGSNTVEMQSGSDHIPQLPSTNPFFRSLVYSTDMKYEDTYIYDKHTFATQDDPRFTHGMQSYKALKENAIEPAVPFLYLRDFNSDHWKVVGTGKPLFGGKESSVTCEDVFKVFVKTCEGMYCLAGVHHRFLYFQILDERHRGSLLLKGIFVQGEEWEWED